MPSKPKTTKYSRNITNIVKEVLLLIAKDKNLSLLAEIAGEGKTLQSYVNPVLSLETKKKSEAKQMKLIAKECGGISAPNAYGNFKSKYTENVKKSLGEKARITEIASELGARWQKLSNDEKTKFTPTKKQVEDHKKRLDKYFTLCKKKGFEPISSKKQKSDRPTLPQLLNIVAKSVMADCERYELYGGLLSPEDQKALNLAYDSGSTRYKTLVSFFKEQRAGNKDKFEEFFEDEHRQFAELKDVFDKYKEAHPNEFVRKSRAKAPQPEVKERESSPTRDVPENTPVFTKSLPDVVTVREEGDISSVEESDEDTPAPSLDVNRSPPKSGRCETPQRSAPRSRGAQKRGKRGRGRK